jgi:hypothetical protein
MRAESTWESRPNSGWLHPWAVAGASKETSLVDFAGIEGLGPDQYYRHYRLGLAAGLPAGAAGALTKAAKRTKKWVRAFGPELIRWRIALDPGAMRIGTATLKLNLTG